MRSRIVTLLFAIGLLAPATLRAETTGWPDTRAGEAAKGWVTAFNAGEDAMREFLATRMSARSLKERAVPARIERYAELREEYGRLQLDRVLQSKPYELTVRLLDGDAKSREFTFKSETRAPWKLESVSIKQPGFHHGFGHGQSQAHGH